MLQIDEDLAHVAGAVQHAERCELELCVPALRMLRHNEDNSSFHTSPETIQAVQAYPQFFQLQSLHAQSQ